MLGRHSPSDHTSSNTCSALHEPRNDTVGHPSATARARHTMRQRSTLERALFRIRKMIEVRGKARPRTRGKRTRKSPHQNMSSMVMITLLRGKVGRRLARGPRRRREKGKAIATHPFAFSFLRLAHRLPPHLLQALVSRSQPDHLLLFHFWGQPQPPVL